MTKVVCALLLIFVMAFVTQVAYGGGEGSLTPQECPGACDYRCSKADRTKKACLNFCKHVLCEMSVRSIRNLWSQGRMSML
ncbi:hypothetical protein GYH30_035062 [Glycine max]|nr:hypothetical protein GYH30_035062 [Glycine max]